MSVACIMRAVLYKLIDVSEVLLRALMMEAASTSAAVRT
jgi:hypothetical protein